jgi:hypothetical protein
MIRAPIPFVWLYTSHEEPFRQLESLASLTNCRNGTKLLNCPPAPAPTRNPFQLRLTPAGTEADAGEGIRREGVGSVRQNDTGG